MCTYIHTYIYIERESEIGRERERDRERERELAVRSVVPWCSRAQRPILCEGRITIYQIRQAKLRITNHGTADSSWDYACNTVGPYALQHGGDTDCTCARCLGRKSCNYTCYVPVCLCEVSIFKTVRSNKHYTRLV